MVTQLALTGPSPVVLRSVGAKRGQISAFRPRAIPASRPLALPAAVQPTQACRRASIITCGGREYLATAAMTECFLAGVRRVIAADDAALVPLLHDAGVDLLLISASTPLRVRFKED